MGGHQGHQDVGLGSHCQHVVPTLAMCGLVTKCLLSFWNSPALAEPAEARVKKTRALPQAASIRAWSQSLRGQDRPQQVYGSHAALVALQGLVCIAIHADCSRYQHAGDFTNRILHQTDLQKNRALGRGPETKWSLPMDVFTCCCSGTVSHHTDAETVERTLSKFVEDLHAECQAMTMSEHVSPRRQQQQQQQQQQQLQLHCFCFGCRFCCCCCCQCHCHCHYDCDCYSYSSSCCYSAFPAFQFLLSTSRLIFTTNYKLQAINYQLLPTRDDDDHYY